MNYKGYTLKEDYDNEIFIFYKGLSADGQKMRHANNLEEAAAEIDELTANDPSTDDKLKIAVQCIEASLEEFIYRANHSEISQSGIGIGPDQYAVFTHHAQLCANALKAIQE